MTNHRARMARIGRFAPPPEGTAARAAFDRLLRKPGEDPRLDQEIQQRWERARALLTAQQDNGTGLLVDKTLRYFHREFNGRAIEHGLHQASASRQVRYVMHDCGNSFLAITDDPDPFLNERGEFADPEFEDTLRETTERIRGYSVLFELYSTFLYLPAYFERFGDLAREERHRTQYGEKARTLAYGAIAQLCPGEERVPFRRVTVLASTGEHFESGSAYFRGPSFHIEKSGYWRRLDPGVLGADRFGEAVHGRTWVEKRLSWVEDESPAAMSRARSRREAAVEPAARQGTDPGWIYVTRSAAHPRNVFKIGLTRKNSERRAEELSSPTGVPDGLFVMHEWQVSNCVEAEAAIHARLSPYRINPKREFFDLPLKEIVRVIEAVLAEAPGT